MNKLIAAIEALPSGHIKYIEYDEFGVWAGFHTVGVEGGLKTDDLKALVAQLKWTPIQSEYDYPNIGDRVLLASNRSGDGLIYDFVESWSEAHATYAGKAFNDYIAYMPIPPYTAERGDENL